MQKPFKDPIAARKKEDGIKEWSFKAPSYDNRTSSSIPGGDDYGIGFRNPVGKFEAKGPDSGPLNPKTRCFSPDEVFKYEDIQG